MLVRLFRPAVESNRPTLECRLNPHLQSIEDCPRWLRRLSFDCIDGMHGPTPGLSPLVGARTAACGGDNYIPQRGQSVDNKVSNLSHLA